NVIILPKRASLNIFRFTDIYKILKKESPHIVHTHGAKANIFYGIAAKLLGCKLVKTTHGECEPSMFMSKTWLKRFVIICCDAIVDLLFDARVFVTNDIAYRGVNRFRHGLSRVIHNSIPDIAVNSEEAKELYDRSRYNVGMVGRISTVKGHVYLLTALRDLKDLIPNIQVHIFGDGPLHRRLERYCLRNSLGEYVIFHGFKKDVLFYQAGLDVLVIPSLHEGLPYSLLYAMKLKVPIVASNVGGLKEILCDEEDGLLIKPKNIKSITTALHFMFSNRDKAVMMAENAFNKVNINFAMSDMLESYINVYQVIISRT
ncbi:glycosyltransferase family 4 protein, partial [Candidatus Omnitrophota bacterium]